MTCLPVLRPRTLWDCRDYLKTATIHTLSHKVITSYRTAAVILGVNLPMKNHKAKRIVFTEIQNKRTH